MALRALKAPLILRESNGKFANRAGEDVEQVFGDHVVTFSIANILRLYF